MDINLSRADLIALTDMLQDRYADLQRRYISSGPMSTTALTRRRLRQQITDTKALLDKVCAQLDACTPVVVGYDSMGRPRLHA